MVQRCISLAGPNGHVTLCINCAAKWFLEASLRETKRNSKIRAFGLSCTCEVRPGPLCPACAADAERVKRDR